MNEIECEVVEIDNTDYLITDEIDDGQFTYLYLSNINNKDDCIIRKCRNTDKDLLLPLDNEEEVMYASKLFNDKYNN